MPILPDNLDKQTIYLIGIDPGTEFLGLAYIGLNAYTNDVVSYDTSTMVASHLPHYDRRLERTHGGRFARLQALREELTIVFNDIRPLYVASEHPFFNPRRPNAFAPLVETLWCIKEALWAYDRDMSLIEVDPSTIKNAVGAKGNCGKEEMHEALLKQQQFIFTPEQVERLDEHSVDAFAVCIHLYQKLLNRGKQ